MLEWDLRDLFGGSYELRLLPMRNRVEEYFRDLDDNAVIGLLVDQRLNETGEATDYTGIDLAKLFRSTFPEMPIYLVTGYDPDDQMAGAESGAVDAVVHKSELRSGSPEAARFKERFLRQARRYEESLAGWQRRFRELIAKRLSGGITAEERAELAKLETERLLPTQAAEEPRLLEVEKQIEALHAVERILEKLRS